jgi:CBS domain-containing protein
MQLKELMTKEVRTVTPDVSACKAAELMATLDVGAIPIVENGAPVGVVTDRDLTLRVVARNLDAGMTRVEDVMTSNPVTLSEQCDVREAAELMKKRQVRRIVVLDDQRKVAGIVSLADLAVSYGDLQVTGEVLEKISEPHKAAHGTD